MTPTQLSISKLRADGWPLVEKVEQPYNHWSKVRKDLFGFGDILAIRGDECLIVQATSKSNAAARIKKILAEPNAAKFIESRHHWIEVHGWFKRRGQWVCEVRNPWAPIRCDIKFGPPGDLDAMI
jgi:hypothetical protein